MDVYLGAMPAQLTQEHPGMHGSRVDKEHSYHILVALFDSKTRERITDARVKATVELTRFRGHLNILGKEVSTNGKDEKTVSAGVSAADD